MPTRSCPYLRGVVIPPVGGDTIWANTATGYSDLPEPLQRLADSLWAQHTNDYDYAGTRLHVTRKQLEHHDQVFTTTVFETEHPLVRLHPDTGERTLILG